MRRFLFFLSKFVSYLLDIVADMCYTLEGHEILPIVSIGEKMKELSEVLAALGTKYPYEKVAQREGPGKMMLSYIPWDDTQRHLDAVFGPFGWSSTAPTLSATPVAGFVVFTSTVTLDVACQGEHGRVFMASRAGHGRAVADLSAKSPAAALDIAAAAAGSDAFSRAAKQLGDAFGLYLYDKEAIKDAAEAARTTTPQPATATAVAPAPNTTDKRPSEKQLPYLLKAGYSKDEVDAMPFQQWKAALDTIFAGGSRAAAKAVKKPENTEQDF